MKWWKSPTSLSLSTPLYLFPKTYWVVPFNSSNHFHYTYYALTHICTYSGFNYPSATHIHTHWPFDSAGRVTALACLHGCNCSHPAWVCECMWVGLREWSTLEMKVCKWVRGVTFTQASCVCSISVYTCIMYRCLWTDLLMLHVCVGF